MASNPTVPPARSRTRRPLGDEIRDAIVADFISNGVTRPGDRLPTEAELCERYGVSRITVRAALRSLQEAGLITVRQGRGSTVLPQSDTITSGLDRLCSVDTFARDAGRAIDTADLEMEVVEADSRLASWLGVEPGAQALEVRRVKLYGRVPVGWIVDYVPVWVLSPDVLRQEFAGSVLDVLLSHPELAVEYSDVDVVPVNLDEELAGRLAVPTGTAALFLDERTYSREGRVINVSHAWLLPEHLRFCVRRRKQFSAA